jgi:hypothetical protein
MHYRIVAILGISEVTWPGSFKIAAQLPTLRAKEKSLQKSKLGRAKFRGKVQPTPANIHRMVAATSPFSCGPIASIHYGCG